METFMVVVLVLIVAAGTVIGIRMDKGGFTSSKKEKNDKKGGDLTETDKTQVS